MDSIFSSIITPGMAGLAAAAIALMAVLGRIVIRGKPINKMKWWSDWGSFVLLVICIAGSFAPGVSDIPLQRWGAILVFASVTTLVAHLGRKLLKPLLLTQLEGKKESRVNGDEKENFNEL